MYNLVHGLQWEYISIEVEKGVKEVSTTYSFCSLLSHCRIRMFEFEDYVDLNGIHHDPNSSPETQLGPVTNAIMSSVRDQSWSG